MIARSLMDAATVMAAGFVSQLEPVTPSAVGQWLWGAVGVAVMVKVALDIKNGWSRTAQDRAIVGQPLQVEEADQPATRKECDRRHRETSKDISIVCGRMDRVEEEIRDSNRRVHERMDKLVEMMGVKFEGMRAEIGGLGGEIRRIRG